MDSRRKKKSKFLLIGMGVVAIIGGAAFWLINRSPAGAATSPSLAPMDPVFPTRPSSVPTTPQSTRQKRASSEAFPLRRGSRGALVKNIQEALIARFGKGVLPRFGADGIWGAEMEAAMRRYNLPTTISANLFRQILTSGALQLSGLDDEENQLRTIKDTTIWDKNGKKVKIPAFTIIGTFENAMDNITRFRTLDNKVLFTHTNTISYV